MDQLSEELNHLPKTNLDPNVQTIIQSIINDIHQTYQQRGIHNVNLIEYKETGEVRGLIGNLIIGLGNIVLRWSH